MHRLFRKRVEDKAFIDAEKANYTVTELCSALEVPRSTYYNKKSTVKEVENKIYKERILHHFEKSRNLYGKRRIQACLKQDGMLISEKRVSKLMSELQIKSKLKAKFKYKKSKKSQPEQKVPFLFENGFDVSAKNVAYSTDITYIKTIEGWLYLCLFMDMHTRKIVGYSIKDRMDQSLVNDAFYAALTQESPPSRLIIHSDKGAQYTSYAMAELCKRHGFVQSMSAAGACYDNAITETLNATIKKELIYQTNLMTKEQAIASIFEYIEVFYNRVRLHSSLGYLSPVDFEKLAA